MQELDAQATVVDPRDVPDGLTTTIARSDVEFALATDELPPLILDVAQRGSEPRSVAVSWRRDDLQRLLWEATEDPIRLTFDRTAIEQAFDDVEAHGLREKALVLTVAVSTAAGFAGSAMAQPVLDTGSPPARTAVVPPATPTDEGTSLGDVAPIAGAIGGAAALAIVGAAFAFTRRRHPTPV